MDQVLQLPDEPAAVPVARRFVAQALRGTAWEDLTADAELVVAELAANALLFGAPPVTLQLQPTPDGVRVEVADCSRVAPMRAIASEDGMTGRGLALVEAVAEQWGVAARGDGKVVWAVLRAGGSGRSEAETARNADALLAGWPDLAGEATGERRYTVELGDVPTDLLLGAKAHVDNLVREFTLATGGASSGGTAPLPAHVTHLIASVTSRFAEARQSIKRQALASAAAGRERTRLVLRLPASAAEAGLDYLAALDEADTYARAARLLTLETSPAHRAFRRWYVTSLVDQLRARAAGDVPEPTPSFEDHLLDELGTVAAARLSADRSARLQEVTASLAGATTPEEVAKLVVSLGAVALGAYGGGLLVPSEDGHLDVPGAIGYDDNLIRQLRSQPSDASMPGPMVLRTGRAVWLESREERDAWFPQLAEMEPDAMALCVVPLIVAGARLGALRFSFDTPRLFDEDERRFALALAGQAAQALDRSNIHLAERHARDVAETAALRLTKLNRMTAALAAASDVPSIGSVVADDVSSTLGASLAALCLLEDETMLRTVELHGAPAGMAERWLTFGLEDDLPASEALRTNQLVVVRSSTEIASRYPRLAGELSGDPALVCVPLSAGRRRLGVLSLTFPPEHVLDDAELELVTSIGQQCAQALERAGLLAAERTARERSTFVADATGLLTSSLEPAQTLRHLTSLIVPRLADWAVVYLVDETGQPWAATAAHHDPTVAEQMLRLQREQPLDVDEAGDLSQVLATGRSIRHRHVPDHVRERTIRRVKGTPLEATLAPDTSLGVPLVTRGRVLGALALARVGGDPYTVEDQQLAEEIATRAAMAVDNAEQFGRERDAALTLQRSLLPQRIPHIPGVSFAWRYLPGSAGTYIGGDWYDVIPLEEGRVALVIGDVMGRGLRAAAVMGQLRATARAHASARLAPSEVLERLDTALGRLEQESITTALFALLDPVNGTLSVASAGHLPPLVSTADGKAHFLDVEAGAPLGAGSPDYPPLTTTLEPGATLLLFTDGLVEDRLLPLDEGLDILARAASGTAGPEALCDRALAALGRDTEHEDDTAMLAVCLRGH